MVGGVLDPDPVQVQPRGELPQPGPVVLVAADEAERIGAEPEHGRVVEHPAGLVADRGVHDLAGGELADVAGDGRLQQRLGVGAHHLELPQRGEVRHHRAFAARPVFVDRAVAVEAGGQPVAAVFGQLPGQPGPARLERRFPRELGLAVRGDAMRDRHREPPLGRVHADVDVGRIPGVGRVDVIGAGRGGADQVGHGPQQDVVPRLGPGLVEQQLVRLAEGGVVEEVEGRPAAPGRDAVRRELRVEVVGAVQVARVAHVLVVLGVAGQRERVVPADGVPHHLHQRAHVLVEELAEQSRLRVGVPGQVAGRGGVQAALGSVDQLAGAEREEVGALPALDVDHLDVLAGLDLVGADRGDVHPQVEQRIGQRRRQRALLRLPRADPPDLQHQVRGRVVRGHGHRPAGRRHHGGEVPAGGELGPRPGRRPLAEQRHGPLPGLVMDRSTVAAVSASVPSAR